MEHIPKKKFKGEPIELPSVDNIKPIKNNESIQMELEEAIVNFVGAEMDEGTPREDIEAFYKAGYDVPGARLQTNGDELQDLLTATSKMRMHYGQNWKDFVEGYFEGALNSYEEVQKQFGEDSEMEV
jgi:hypothetical protein